MASSKITIDFDALASPAVELDNQSLVYSGTPIFAVNPIDMEASISTAAQITTANLDVPVSAIVENTKIDLDATITLTVQTTGLTSDDAPVSPAKITTPAVQITKINLDVPLSPAEISTIPSAVKITTNSDVIPLGNKYIQNLPLYKAVLRGEKNTAIEFIKQGPDTIKAILNTNSDTILHVAVGTEKATSLVAALVQLMSDDMILQKDGNGNTALHIAAMTGNRAAAEILIARLPGALYVQSRSGALPIHWAALSGHKDLLQYFVSETKDDVDPNPYDGQCGIRLMLAVINAEFFDLALYLVNKYPFLAVMRYKKTGFAALEVLASKASAFCSGARFNFWQRLAYTFARLDNGSEVADMKTNTNDIENPTCGSALSLGGWFIVIKKWYCKTSKHLIQIVLYVKDIHGKKLKHQQATMFLKCLCKHMEASSDDDALGIASYAMRRAVELNILEFVEIVVEAFPESVFSRDHTKQVSMFHIAIINRCEKVYNLIYQMSGHKHHLIDKTDFEQNTLLHLAARLATPYRLNLVSGAALQMQREIQWFKAVEKIVPPYAKILTNKYRKNAYVLFTEEHEKLKADGEKWMKDTANSCTIAAALIATVVFAAAITVPGGNAGETGFPMFSGFNAFIVFAVSDVISLFTSSTSLLMFLSILMSRYSEEDFLYALPRRLCIGLVTLFVSILFMMMAFSATAFMVFGRQKIWVLIPVGVLACLPVASFVLLQFPLLVDVVSSTYGCGIFGKQCDRPFY